MSKKVICIIPARIGSTRLPRKPLALIGGIPMIQRTYEAAMQASFLNKVVVATDSHEIAEVIEKIGGTVMMTDSHIPTGSDRVATVAKHYSDMDIVINLQGDEPFVQASMLETLVEPFFTDSQVKMSTLACPLDMEHVYPNPNLVKVIVDQKMNAIYFSRAPIPYLRAAHFPIPVFHHQGIYAFEKDFLQTFCALEPTPLEKVELLEQLRAIAHGYSIRVCVTPHQLLEINTEEELKNAEEFLRRRIH